MATRHFILGAILLTGIACLLASTWVVNRGNEPINSGQFQQISQADIATQASSAADYSADTSLHQQEISIVADADNSTISTSAPYIALFEEDDISLKRCSGDFNCVEKHLRQMADQALGDYLNHAIGEGEFELQKLRYNAIFHLYRKQHIERVLVNDGEVAAIRLAESIQPLSI